MIIRSAGMRDDPCGTRWGSYPRRVLYELKRRSGWLSQRVGPRGLFNAAIGAVDLAASRARMTSWPLIVKIDISPLCNLRCTVCVHAAAGGNPELQRQRFKAGQKMRIEQYGRIIDEIGGKTSMVSLYYLGDPLMHPDLIEMCRMASEAQLNTHISTNLSFSLTDGYVRGLITSGLTHMTVCLDGMTQATYGLTRVGGHVDKVLGNLRRFLRCRNQLGRVLPRIEVQYIKFQHNLHELEEAVRFCGEAGVDRLTYLWGDLCNYTDYNVSLGDPVSPKRRGLFPLCVDPYVSMLIKYDGDVIPCCFFRQGTQYSDGYSPRVLGNVLERGVWAVWNSAEYQAVRRLVARPRLVDLEPRLRETFCYGCERIFEPFVRRGICRNARRYSFEDVYAIGRGGVPVRRGPLQEQPLSDLRPPPPVPPSGGAWREADVKRRA